MEENYNKNESDEQPKRKNLFKNWTFYTTYFVVIGIFFLITWLFTGGFTGDYWIINAMLLCIPYALVGLVGWAIAQIKSKAMALGILLAGITPFVVIFVMTGGCGLWR